MSAETPATGRLGRWNADWRLRPLALSGGFVVAYVALDWLSFVHALHGIAITPWNPQHGLALALVLIGGRGYAPALFVAPLVSWLLASGVTVPIVPAAVAATAIAVGYTLAALLLTRVFRFDAALPGSRDVTILLATALIAAVAVALAFVAVFVAAGIVPREAFWEAVFQYWIGDAIGIAVLTPLVLVVGAPREPRAPGHLLETLAQAGSVLLALFVVFGIDSRESFKLFYLLFLPLIWIAARRGLVGAAIAVLAIQLGLLAALELLDQSSETVRSFQLLMFTIAATGQLLGALVSERRRAERALRAGEARLQAILATAPDAIVTIDGTGRVEEANHAAERLFGADARHLAGRRISTLVPALEGRLPADAAASAWETTARRIDGTTLPVELTAGGGEAGASREILVVRDVSRRKEIEARAREHEAELAHVSRLSVAGEMASALAHELNQPLTAILAYTQGCRRILAADGDVPPRLVAAFDAVVQQAERAGSIIQRLREFLREGVSRRSTVAVEELVREALGLAEIEAAQSGISVRLELPPDLPFVIADRIQIEQVLVNLVRNAVEAIVEASPARREITIAARAAEGAVEVAVTDTGPGVAPQVKDRLFQPFVTMKTRGMGLGLSISRSIVEAHGGRLWTVSREGAGAQFRFTLPLARNA
jgi:PAS domain S-box-containing protein